LNEQNRSPKGAASAQQLWRMNALGLVTVRDSPAEPLTRGEAKEVLAQRLCGSACGTRYAETGRRFAVASGFARFLRRSTPSIKPDELERRPPIPTRQKAPAKSPDRTEPMSLVTSDKKVVPVAKSVGEFGAEKSKKETGRLPSYVWRSQRASESPAMDFADTRF